jgi:hypothetical protein
MRYSLSKCALAFSSPARSQGWEILQLPRNSKIDTRSAADDASLEFKGHDSSALQDELLDAAHRGDHVAHPAQ